MRVLLALIGLVLFPAVAEARPVCGPSHVKTLARAGDARLYKDGTRAFGCVKGTRPVSVGVHVTRVRLAGDFAAVVHSKALTVYDLRDRRVDGAPRLNHPAGRVRGLSLTATGAAAWIEDRANGRREARDSVSGTQDTGDNIDPAFVHIAGSVISWFKGGYVKLAVYDGGDAPDGSLGSVGDVELGTRNGEGLTARYRQGRIVDLGGALAVYGGPAVLGVDALRVAGAVVATRYTDVNATRHDGFVYVDDLIRGGARSVCETRQVTNFVVTASGAVACVTSDGTNRIVSEGAVLDQGDVTALDERHGRLVWRHGRETRTAPLPPAQLAPVRYPCGPAKAGTFELTDAARVYVTAGRAYACRQGAATAPTLGAAARIRQVLLKGDFAAVRRTAGTSESLHVYSVSSGREIGPGAVSLMLSDVQLSPAGVAVFLDYAWVVRDTLGTTYMPAGTYALGLRLTGDIVSWGEGKSGPVELRELGQGAIQAPDEDGPILSSDPYEGHVVSVGLEHGRLLARLNGGAPVDIGAAREIQMLDARGTVAGTLDRGGVITMYDLASGGVTHPCPAPQTYVFVDVNGRLPC